MELEGVRPAVYFPPRDPPRIIAPEPRAPWMKDGGTFTFFNLTRPSFFFFFSLEAIFFILCFGIAHISFASPHETEIYHDDDDDEKKSQNIKIFYIFIMAFLFFYFIFFFL